MISNNVRLLIAAIFIFALGGCSSLFGPSTEVLLSVTGPTHPLASGQALELQLSLRNDTNDVVQVSEWLDGSYHVVSLERDGVAVAKRVVRARYYLPLESTLPQRLRSIQTGEKLELSWRSDEDPGLGGQAISDVQFEPSGKHTVTFYDVDKLGNYELTLNYHYVGKPNGHANVFRNRSNNVTISFAVR